MPADNERDPAEPHHLRNRRADDHCADARATVGAQDERIDAATVRDLRDHPAGLGNSRPFADPSASRWNKHLMRATV